jgi:hypothetical protein
MKIPGAEKIKERLPATNGKKTGGKKRKPGKKKARREERIGMSGVVYKYTFREKIMYMVDAWLSRGTLSTIIFLLAVTGALGFVIGILVMHFGGVDVSLRRSLWDTFNHIIDPGVLSGDSGSPLFIVLMLLATVIGLLFLAMLIGLINDGIQRRVANLSKGLEPVIEQNHIVILGFNESTFIILGELIEACRNQKNRRNVAVVMDEIPKTEMEDRIRIEFPKTGNLKVVEKRRLQSGVISCAGIDQLVLTMVGTLHRTDEWGYLDEIWASARKDTDILHCFPIFFSYAGDSSFSRKS